MRSPHFYIVEPVDGRRYSNILNIGGTNLLTSVSEEDHKASNRFAKVISTPINYSGPIKPGDILVVHHNVFKYYNDMKGRRKSGRSFLRDGLFFVDSDQFFMYHDGTDWKSRDRFCFVSPIEKKKSILSKPGRYEPLFGKMEYPNEYLSSLNVKKGDTIVFTPDSEYEFKINDKVMYRVFDHQITINMDERE